MFTQFIKALKSSKAQHWLLSLQTGSVRVGKNLSPLVLAGVCLVQTSKVALCIDVCSYSLGGQAEIELWNWMNVRLLESIFEIHSTMKSLGVLFMPYVRSKFNKERKFLNSQCSTKFFAIEQSAVKELIYAFRPSIDKIKLKVSGKHFFTGYLLMCFGCLHHLSKDSHFFSHTSVLYRYRYYLFRATLGNFPTAQLIFTHHSNYWTVKFKQVWTEN